MLTLFENVTANITQLERETLVPMLVSLLKKTSEKKRFTGRQIIEHFTRAGYPISQIRLCRMVQYIRVCDTAAPYGLIGSGSGYFLTDDPEKVEDQIMSLDGRINSMRSSQDALKATKLNLERRTNKITETVGIQSGIKNSNDGQ